MTEGDQACEIRGRNDSYDPYSFRYHTLLELLRPLTSAEASIGRDCHDEVLLRPSRRVDAEFGYQGRFGQFFRPFLQDHAENDRHFVWIV